MNANLIKALADDYAESYDRYSKSTVDFAHRKLHAAIDEMQQELDEVKAALAKAQVLLNTVEDIAAENNGQDYLVGE